MNSKPTLMAMVELTEAYDSKSGTLTMTVIRPGFNSSKGRYYPSDVLKRDCKIFEGAKMFTDHQTDRELKERPEGSIKDWVGSIKKVWAETDGTIKANAVVVDPAFKAKMATLAEQNMLTEMGVSIRAVGNASTKKVEGHDTSYVESLFRCKSVDFVTYAGAGGQVELMESSTANQDDVDLVTIEQLRERRPDLVTLIESKKQKETELEKNNEQLLAEAQTEIATLKAENTTLKTQLSESKKAAAASTLAGLIVEAKLPEIAATRIKQQFQNAEEVTGMKEAVVAEADYIKSLGTPAPKTPKTSVTNLGEKDNSTPADPKVDLKESFSFLGLSKEQAEIAAGR